MQILFLIVSFVLLTPLLGSYMERVFTGKPTFVHPVLSWLEILCYRAGGINPHEEMTAKSYAKNWLLFNLYGFAALFLLLLIQLHLPLNPQRFAGTSPHLAFNIAASFATNTNWQSYAGESTLSYLSQMLGLGVQNFLSASAGMAALLVLIRGFTRKSSTTIGNFWADLVRTLVYLLLPLAIILSLILVLEGSIQTFSPYVEATGLENNKQLIPLGPVASQVAIKQLGSNGGGFFNANSAHPFENPTSITNFLELLAILLIPAATVYMYGIMVGSKKHGWLLFGAMFLFWIIGIGISTYSENLHNPFLEAYPNMEGKETRFGIMNSLLWSISTTSTSNGSVNAMISSLSPLAGGWALFNIMLGEMIFGGIGVGLAGMLMFVLLTVFLAGLMVGRTPEYFGKKIEKMEMQWVTLCVLVPSSLVLIGAGISCLLPIALSSLENHGPHGLTEMIYAFMSPAGNNGSSFAGLDANNSYFNIILGTIMLIARLTIILASIFIGGALAEKKSVPFSIGTFSTNTILFFSLLIFVIVIAGALTFFPALALGPIVEHLLLQGGYEI